MSYYRECDFNSLGSWSCSNAWMLHYFREVKCQLYGTSGIQYQKSNSNWYSYESRACDLMVSTVVFCFQGLGSFSGRPVYQFVHPDMVNFLLNTNDRRDRRSNLLFMQFGVLAMLRLKLWSARVESHHPAFVGNWWTIICTFSALSAHSMSSPSRK